MHRFLSRLALWGLGGLLLLGLVPSGVTADLPLDKLNEATIRQRVAAALAADTSPETAALKDLVNVDPAGISYQPGALNWRYQPKGGTPLIREQRQGVENALRAVLGRALGQAPGADNLRPEDLATVQKSATFTPVAQLPPPAPAGTGQPVTPPVPPAVAPQEIEKLRAALRQAERDRAEQAKKLADLAEQVRKLEGLDEQAKKLAAAQDSLKKLADDVKAAQDAARKVRDDVKSVREGAKQLGEDFKGVQDTVKKLDGQVADNTRKLAEQNKALSGDLTKLAARLEDEAKGRLAEMKRLADERKQMADQATADLKKLSEETALKLRRLAEQNTADLSRANVLVGEQVKKVNTLLGTENEKLRANVDEQVARANARLVEEARRINDRIDDTFKKANARIDAESAQLGQRMTGGEQRTGLQMYRLDRRLNRLVDVLPVAPPPPPPAARPADPCAPSARGQAGPPPPPPAAPPAAPGPMPGPGLRGLLQAPGVVTVRLPAEARLYADNVPIPLASSTRTFLTPPLDYGEIYKYNLRAEVGQGTDRRTLTRTVPVEADKTTTVDLNDVLRQPTPGGKPGASAGGVEKLGWTVVLEGLADPTRKGDVIQALRALTGMRGEEAQDLVDRAPRRVQSYLDRKEAEAAVQKLRDAGAKVSLK